jgi:hypothetical protein
VSKWQSRVSDPTALIQIAVRVGFTRIAVPVVSA